MQNKWQAEFVKIMLRGYAQMLDDTDNTDGEGELRPQTTDD